jgi:hypothetical protein
MSTTVSRIKLWCLLLGSNIPFKVVIEQDNDIYDLKKFIKDERKNDLSNVDASNLILWNVEIDQSLLNDKGFSINERLTDENKLSTPADTIGATFFNVGGTNIRVIAGVPVATSKLLITEISM